MIVEVRLSFGECMSARRKYNFIIPIGITISLLLTGCFEDKTTQCQRLIQVVNAGNSLIEQNKGQQVITSLQLSKDLEAITTSLAELNFTDPNLKEFQTGFIKVFQNISQAIATAGKALGAAKLAEESPTGKEKLKKARTEIDTALTKVANTTGKEADTLVKELNKYCNQPE
ncbi:all1252 [Nostoc sp. PCC 7120 = FACHB-418]|nr:all1252 [Nostoc sp. PCC 7120 = FACHB-418]